VFMPYFAAQLRDLSKRPTSVAIDGAILRHGEILIAPGTQHIGLSRTGTTVRIKLDASPVASRCLPSVDPMFEAVAAVYGARGAGVVLTGMGRDGTIGAEAMTKAGAEVLVQDAATSVVWGMPGSIAQAGMASAVLPPERIAQHLCARAGLH